ncbi:DUF6417 family protein [Streptomyces mirabilis]|nr:DUF6417 family protein [Streptomyces mirabilis]
MAALRVFVGLTGQLRVPPADGLVEQVRTASCDHGIKRWRLYLTPEQMVSVAYGLWLHRMTGSATEANRFGREYGVVHSPARAGDEGPRPPTACRRRPEQLHRVVRGPAGEGDGDGLVGAVTEDLGERGVFGGVDGQAPPGLVGDPVGGVLAAVALGGRPPGAEVLVGLAGRSRRAPGTELLGSRAAWVQPVPSGSRHAARSTASLEVSRCR